MAIATPGDLRTAVQAAVRSAPVLDIHTHLYAPAFGPLLLRGIDDLLTYHYLVAEALRWLPIPYGQFWSLGKGEQADLIWRTLFLERSPCSEACQGVLTALRLLGLDAGERDLNRHREALAGWRAEDQVDRVLRLANVAQVVMTNDPFDPAEQPLWLQGWAGDPRFRAALRLDRVLNGWSGAVPLLQAQGYGVDAALGEGAMAEVRRFLTHWIRRMAPVYLASSLPHDFAFPDPSPRTRLLTGAVLPVAREHGLPFAMMIGVKRGVNPGLREAGDSVGAAAMGAVENLCAAYPGQRFLVTMLARENQHELAVTARKFRNLMVFGIWWFLNNPTLIREITRLRLELLGTSFIPQHSDARVLEQVLYKWDHARALLAEALVEKYSDLLAAGWRLEAAAIAADVQQLLAGNARQFLGQG